MCICAYIIYVIKIYFKDVLKFIFKLHFILNFGFYL